MYCLGDVGELSMGNCSGPSELTKYHSSIENRVIELVNKYDLEETYKRRTVPVPVFSFECNTNNFPINLHQFEKDVLK